ncbi:hypothetical protein AVEN_113902-1 [Araneus ventricosus]|uniref:Uncharacterized protein n=1 Tax=Araneus ventricosus TaxID=182803 RepID=A0A4Y2M1V9_ARAVE|nr:hypothetical protein AVEN_113902-1 [Araneus ventricosus]
MLSFPSSTAAANALPIFQSADFFRYVHCKQETNLRKACSFRFSLGSLSIFVRFQSRWNPTTHLADFHELTCPFSLQNISLASFEVMRLKTACYRCSCDVYDDELVCDFLKSCKLTIGLKDRNRLIMLLNRLGNFKRNLKKALMSLLDGDGMAL